jgi:predicted DNA binding CopG/RHH family protein
MVKSKSLISNASSYKQIGEFWDKHSLADYDSKTKPAKMKFKAKSIQYTCTIEKTLFKQLFQKAESQGLPINTLINIYLKEKVV